MLSPIELEIMTALACKVRVMSEGQLLRAWDKETTEEILLSLEKLLSKKLVQANLWDVVLLETNRKPIFTWKPNDPTPDTWMISKEARQRWKKSKKTRVLVYQATELAGRIFGSRSGHPIRDIERQHDLLLGEVFVDYLQEFPSLAERWFGEDTLPMAPRGVKNPDAFLLDEELRTRRVIESTGAYSQRQVDAFHNYCRTSHLPYELW